MGDRDRVVDRRSLPPVRLAVVDGEELDELRDERADPPGLRQPPLHLRPGDGLVRDVEPDHRHVDVGGEDERGGLGVGPDVELGSRGHVALGDRPAHDDDLREPVGAVPLEVSRDVRQRSRRDERHGSRRRGDGRGNPADGVGRDRLGARLRQRRAVEAALAVHVRGDDELALERPVGTRGDRHIRAASELEHAQRVRGRLLERLVPVGRRHAEELELRAREREEQRDRVVVAGVAVEDDRRRAHPGLSSRARASRARQRLGYSTQASPPPQRRQDRVDLGGGRERRLRAEARRGKRARGAGTAERLPPPRAPRAARRAGTP